MAAIYPSLISGNLLNLQQEINRLAPVSSGFHIDIMDNHFVPNLTWGPAFINALEKASPIPLWVHAMVDSAQLIIDAITLRPGSIFSFHIETRESIPALIRAIRERQWLVSIAISPQTPIEYLEPFMRDADQILVMSVKPGFSGQHFLEDAYSRIAAVEHMRSIHQLKLSIGIDGGINSSTIVKAAQVGATQFAVAQGIFGAADPLIALSCLSDLADR